MSTKYWEPEILYEDDSEGFSSHIPFIHVPPEEAMPRMLFIFESRDTGEFEPGPEGVDLPVTELDLHQYANMVTLKETLSPSEYDYLRHALGLESLAAAALKGQKITNNIRDAFSSDSLDDVSEQV